ncbi:MAG: preprotein translocase subunit SecG [Bacteroidales bacterium]|nr:preprotein translocase subunit SecG [Bacteroidales bacterium]
MDLLAVSTLSHTLNAIIVFISIVMILFIVVIQRGKGGGLAGALGGAGGSSAFGSRAADAFVKYTLILAGVWVLLIMIHVKVANVDSQSGGPRVVQGS